jgi:hypothetical protein
MYQQKAGTKKFSEEEWEMKLFKRIGIAALLMVCAVAWAGSAWAWSAGSSHETRAYIYAEDGKTYYSGEYAPVFFGLRPSVVETSDNEYESGNGIFTVSLPAGTSIGWINQSERYYVVEPEQSFSEKEEFSIEKFDVDSHRVVGENYREDVYIINNDYYTYFTTNAEEVIPQSEFSVVIEGAEFFEDKPFAPLHTTKQQMDAKCVPYIELITRDGNITGLKWRFVDPAKPEVPLVRGANSDITAIADFVIWTKEYYHRHNEDLIVLPKAGDPLEGTLYLTEPYPVAEVGRVSISFAYDMDMSEFFVPGAVFNLYSWSFEFKESAPEQEPEVPDQEPEVEVVDEDEAWDLKTGIEVVAKYPELEDVTDEEGKPLPEKMEKEGTDKTTITTMPVFAVSVEDDSIARMSYNIDLNSIASKGYKVKDLTLLKLMEDGNLAEFERVDVDPQKVKDGQFTVTTPYGGLDSNDGIKRDISYIFHFGVRDNGAYDWDINKGSVVDPAAIAAKLPESDDGDDSNNTSSGGGGGCNTGYGLFGLLLAGILTFKYRKA